MQPGGDGDGGAVARRREEVKIRAKKVTVILEREREKDRRWGFLSAWFVTGSLRKVFMGKLMDGGKGILFARMILRNYPSLQLIDYS